ncbi:MAG: alpha/beta hydrolase [Candidatus Hydrogenedentota bacterium]
MLLKIGAVVLVGYLAAASALFLAQRRVLFQTSRDLYRTPAENGWPFEDVWCDVVREKTHGWYIPAEAGKSKGVILFSHGNAGNIADRLESIGIFRGMNYDVLVYDYGGYGQSTGAPSEKRCYEDIRAMWRYLIEERGVAAASIVLFGRSLGAGPACQLATEVEARAVVLESAFRSVPRMAQDLYRIFPGKLLTRDHFANEDKVGRLRSPVLFVHSPDDEIIPYAHGKWLFEHASGPKQFFEIRGRHNEGFWQAGDSYISGLNAFLDPHPTAIN